MLKNLMIAAVAASTIGTTLQADNYLCIPDQVTGFYFDGSKWRRTDFTTDSKWLIDITDGQASVSRIGDNAPTFHTQDCKIYFDISVECSLIGEFKMGIQEGRYMRTYTGGYTGGDRTEHTPLIEIGRCSPL